MENGSELTELGLVASTQMKNGFELVELTFIPPNKIESSSLLTTQ